MNIEKIYLPERGHQNYYHFLFYMVSNFRFLTVTPKVIALNISQSFLNPQKYVITILKKLFPNTEILNSNICPEGFVTLKQDRPQITREEAVEPEIYTYLRQLLLPHIQNINISKKYSKNIYISRKFPNNRLVLNEEQFLPFLQKNKFDVLDLDSTIGLEQIAIFNNAERVMGVHGAGLSNIVFCNKKAQVIELCTQKMTSLQHFSHIAETLNLNYNRYINPSNSIDYNANMIIDLNKIDNLQKLLEYEI